MQYGVDGNGWCRDSGGTGLMMWEESREVIEGVLNSLRKAGLKECEQTAV